MRKALLTTVSAGAMLAAGPALAADMVSVGVGGYMQQWFGVSGVDATDKDGKATAVEGGVAQQSDSEIHFRGKLEADNGLTFSVKVELEGNSRASGKNGKSDSPIDESQLTISSEFGQIVLGAEDGASVLTHHGNRDVGISMLCGDVGKWINGVSGCPSGSKMGFGTAGHGVVGDSNKISYFTPRMNGVQAGVSYVPNTGQEGENAPLGNNDHDAVSLGANYVGDFGGASVAVSAGFFSASQTIKKPDTVKTYGSDGTAAEATLALEKAYPAKKIDERTFANFGLTVDFGGIGFDVAYAENDGGLYKMVDDEEVKNGAADYEVVSAGVNYTEGPMAVSLGHYMAEDDDGSESNATMLSVSYTLAPGVVSRSSLFAAEQSKGTDKTSAEGTAFVTGITISF